MSEDQARYEQARADIELLLARIDTLERAVEFLLRKVDVGENWPYELRDFEGAE